MWLKGNLHTHTNESDGDAPPETGAAWYAAHGYDFLAITDHNKVTLPASDQLLLINSTEITLHAERKPVHVNAFNIGEMQFPIDREASIFATLQQAVDVTNAAGGLAMINHPNFRWAFGADEMAKVRNWSLLEIYNASTETNNFGFGGRIGVETMWDRLLTAGMRVHGVATDDSHEFIAERWGHVSPPGLAWVQVWTEDKSVEAIMRALANGDFYASTEIAIEELMLGEAE
ncbi:MAG: CehA/McbA family metallohydrolase, partial [Chloroflexi bacterium]|nr:CehA/McbA family metallohydrolase [Chloroflexota bacterium]